MHAMRACVCCARAACVVVCAACVQHAPACICVREPAFRLHDDVPVCVYAPAYLLPVHVHIDGQLS